MLTPSPSLYSLHEGKSRFLSVFAPFCDCFRGFSGRRGCQGFTGYGLAGEEFEEEESEQEVESGQEVESEQEGRERTGGRERVGGRDQERGRERAGGAR